MKVYDIISEDSDLNEFKGLAQWALGGGRAASVERLANQWADDIVKAWRNGTNPKFSWPKDIPRNMLRDKGFMKDALSKAKWQARKLVVKGTAARMFATAGTASKIFTNAVWGVAVAWGVGEPIIKTYNNISKAEEAMESGHPDWDQKAVDAYARRELAWCVAQVSAIIATMGAAGIASRVTFIKRFFPNLSNLGSAAAITWMSSGPGREAIANWLVGSSLSSTTFEKYVGGLMLRGKDEIERGVSSADSSSGSTTGTTSGTTSSSGTADKEKEPNGPLSAKGISGDDDNTPIHKIPDARTGRIL